MMQIRRAGERGHAQHGWLDSRHTFSFADYYDPQFMGFGPLRVINEDRVQPGKGFGAHSHRDMEIISYVLEGSLEHKDSLGNGSVIRPGDVQRLSAGTGVRHSEFNHSDTEPVHFLQIWLLPRKQGMPPSYEQRRFEEEEKRGRLRLIASQDGRDDSVVVHQDVDIFAARLEDGDELLHRTSAQRKTWVHVATGAAVVDGESLEAGDGAAIVQQDQVALRGTGRAEILLFDMA